MCVEKRTSVSSCNLLLRGGNAQCTEGSSDALHFKYSLHCLLHKRETVNKKEQGEKRRDHTIETIIFDDKYLKAYEED